MSNTRRAKGVSVRRTDPFGSAPTVHRLRVDLLGTEPAIWRQLEVRSDCSLTSLHLILQTAFAWEGYHLWQFAEVRKNRIGAEVTATQTVASAIPAKGDKLVYTYDFGDGWEHLIVVEGVAAASDDTQTQYPRCLAGENVAPPEDCGGVWGYEALLEILADPGHPEHDDRLEWMGLTSAEDFDPTAFDPFLVNHDLRALIRLNRR
jgi:hypothetical protein